jgi:hypothetical protein
MVLVYGGQSKSKIIELLYVSVDKLYFISSGKSKFGL